MCCGTAPLRKSFEPVKSGEWRGGMFLIVPHKKRFAREPGDGAAAVCRLVDRLDTPPTRPEPARRLARLVPRYRAPHFFSSC